MRILLTNTSPDGSGSFSAILGITKELEKLGHKVKIFFPDNYCSNTDKCNYEIWQFPIKKNGLKISNFPLITPSPRPQNSSHQTFSDLSREELALYFTELEAKIANTIKTFKPDVIECHHIWTVDYVISKLGFPYISVAHNSDQDGFHNHPQMQKYAKYAAEKAKYIFAVSENVRKKVIDSYNIDPNKVIVCHNAYAKNIFTKKLVDRKSIYQKLNLNIPPDAYIIIFVGNISKAKGIDILLQANRLLSPQKQIHFILLGAGSIEEITQDNIYTQNNYCLDRVHTLGYQSAEMLVDLYNIAKIKVMPSRSEGFSIACLEAMGCGLPVIASADTNMENIIIGDIYDTNNPNSLAKSIEKIYSLPKHQYQTLSDNACKIANKYSWKNIVQSRLPYYKENEIIVEY